MEQIPFAIATTTARNIKANNETLVNLYAEVMPPSAKNNSTLIGTPGNVLFATTTTGPILNTHVFKNELYAVTETKLYKISSVGAISEIGTVDFTGKTYVSMANNGQQIIMVAGDGYYFDGVATVAKITDTEYYQSSMVTFQDGYFILVRDGTQQFFISELNSVSFIGTDFASAEGSPDNLVGLISDHRQLWLFGELSIEVWYNSGNADFPFERIQGSFAQRGCLNARTISAMDNTVYWVGDDGMVYRANGYTPTRISNEATEYEIAKIASSELEAFTYYEEGHYFYCLSMNGNVTLVYDAKTQLWHTRKSVGTKRWMIHGVSNVYDKIIGFSDTAKAYEVSLDYTTEDGTVINREAITTPISKGVDYFTVSQFEVDMETGQSSIGTEDEISIEISKDGGQTFSFPRSISLGKIAEFKTRAVWRRLGRARNMSIRVKTRSKAPIRIIGAQASF